jgi:acyl-CoA reductase-like NAD-dependent aldehyde dehydrogenase
MTHCELLIDGFFIGGPCDQATGKQVVRAPFDGHIVGTAAEGGFTELRGCVDAAHEAFQTWRRSPRRERQRLLRNIASLVRERREELVDLLTHEVGKPIVWSRGEVDRLTLTFDLAADEVSWYGLEAMPVDFDPRGDGVRCTVERFPLGVVFCIVPYNWPFNLAAHKIAPALATGNTVVLKPSPLAPLSTLTLARLIHEAGCPPGVINAWNGPTQAVEKVLPDPRIKMLSFTGSVPVGWSLKEKFADRRIVLELGGDASVIVAADADLEWATKRIIAGGYGYAGQVCIAVQHVLVERAVYDGMRQRLTEATLTCPTGDPTDEATVCGPLINEAAAEKVQAMVEEAVTAGATVLAGGKRSGALYQPTLVENVPSSTCLAHEEVFGPVLTLQPFDHFADTVARVNASPYGIQAGVFTRDPDQAEFAFRELQVGGVVINDYPTLRFDNMPYGGVKRSGFGREGVRYAMDEMTEPKTLLVRTSAQMPPPK